MGKLYDNSKSKEGNGTLKLAAEKSPYRNLIDAWLNEGKSCQFISDELSKIGDDAYISVTSIQKYKRVREKRIQDELEKSPDFVQKQAECTQMVNDKIGEIKVVDLMGNLSNLISDSAELLAEAKMKGVSINNVKDMRMIQQTMLDAINAYGTTMLNAQKFQEIQKDPSLLSNQSTTINIEIKEALADILKESVKDGGDGYGLIDQLRNGLTGK